MEGVEEDWMADVFAAEAVFRSFEDGMETRKEDEEDKELPLLLRAGLSGGGSLEVAESGKSSSSSLPSRFWN
jgi:hypothetical protein